MSDATALDTSYGALLSLTEGHGTGVIYEHIRDLTARLASLERERNVLKGQLDADDLSLYRAYQDIKAAVEQAREEVKRLYGELDHVRKIVSPTLIGRAECERIDAALTPAAGGQK